MKYTLLCPRCHDLSGTNWEEVRKETILFAVTPDNKNPSIKHETKKVIDSEHIVTRHICSNKQGDYFETESFTVEDFLVAIHEDGTIEPVGDYYLDFPEDIK